MEFNLNFEYNNEKKEKEIFKEIINEYEEEKIGYYHLPEDSIKFSEINFDTTKYEDILVVGIGGSFLGTKMVYDIAKHKFNTKKMLFLENPDPIDITEKLKEAKNPLIFIISKSGKTIETISIFKELINKLNLKENSENLKIITDPDSPLDNFAKQWNLETFYIPSNVGGRFSVLSAVGIVPLLSAGLNIKELLKGSRYFLDSFFKNNENHLIKKACFYGENQNKFSINVLFAYSSILNSFKDWYVQLFGESLGKNNKEIMPVGHIGSIDQHSFLQLLMEGKQNNKTLTFLHIKNFSQDIKIPNIKLPFLEDTDFVNGNYFSTLLNKECEATKEALLEKNYPIDEIIIEEVSLYEIGILIIYYELLTSAIGKYMKINTYDQPGVEVGKKILKTKF